MQGAIFFDNVRKTTFIPRFIGGIDRVPKAIMKMNLSRRNSK